MSLNISQQTEARLTEEARRQGITVDALLERLINERAVGAGPEGRNVPGLPVWRLGVISSLHRRDIYTLSQGSSMRTHCTIARMSCVLLRGA